MRLTVHVKEAQQYTIEKKTKDGTKFVKKTINTLSFNNVKKNEVPQILQTIENEELGIPTKHYLSNEKQIGHSKTKKKS